MAGDDENLVSVGGEDEVMLAAINEARQSIEIFLNAFVQPKPNQRSFLVKIAIDEEGKREHIWFADIDLATTPPTGVVANEPSLKSIQFMQRVPIDFTFLSDWMFYEDDVMVGGFTSKLLDASLRSN